LAARERVLPGYMPFQARQATRGTPDLLVLSSWLPDALHVHIQRAEEQAPVEAQAPEQDAVVPARGHKVRVSVGMVTSVALSPAPPTGAATAGCARGAARHSTAARAARAAPLAPERVARVSERDVLAVYVVCARARPARQPLPHQARPPDTRASATATACTPPVHTSTYAESFEATPHALCKHGMGPHR